jgi:hypothetical protein
MADIGANSNLLPMIQSMDDTAFLAERIRVRETLEILQEQMRVLDTEFNRRATAWWTGQASDPR